MAVLRQSRVIRGLDEWSRVRLTAAFPFTSFRKRYCKGHLGLENQTMLWEPCVAFSYNNDQGISSLNPKT